VKAPEIGLEPADRAAEAADLWPPKAPGRREGGADAAGPSVY